MPSVRQMWYSELRRMPVLRAALPLFLGMVGGGLLSDSATFWFAAVVCILFVLIILNFRPFLGSWIQGILASVFFFALGAFLLQSEWGDRPPKGENIYQATVIRTFGSSSKVSRTLCELEEQDSGSRFKALVTFMIDSTSQIASGDVIGIETEIDEGFPEGVPGSFSRKNWAERIGARGEAFCGMADYSILKRGTGWVKNAGEYRKGLARKLEVRGLQGANLATMKALLLGDRSDLTYDQQAAFRESGTIHVLAVSGLHVGIIYLVLIRLIKLVGRGRERKWLTALLTVLGLSMYTWITGASPSVLRASAMFSVFAFARVVDRSTNAINSLSIAALLILIYDPFMAFSVGFRLSFLAVLGIILLYRTVHTMIDIPYKWLDAVWALAAVSIVAQLATGPLAVHEFGAFPSYFLPANIIVVFIVSILVHLGAAILLVDFVPLLPDLLATIADFLLTVIDHVTIFVAGLPSAYVAVRLDIWQMGLLYLTITLLVISTKRKFYRPLVGLPLVVLLASWAFKVSSSHERSQFVVHDTFQAPLISQLNGRSLTVFGDVNGESRKRITEYVNAVGIDEVHWTEPEPNTSNWLLNDSVGYFNVDVPSENGRVWHSGQLIIGRDMPWRERRRLKDVVGDSGIRIHDIRTSGAFVR